MAENVILREMIADKKTAASLLAQAAAGASTTVVHATNGLQAPPGASVDTTLGKIEINTDETAKNTARTEATVKKLEEA